MRTTATNKKIREILSDIGRGKLKLRPPFQRRLVWLNKHRADFIKTVLEGFPFPEIFIATGELNVETAEGTDLLVDGQQRVTAIRDYFTGAKGLVLPKTLEPYASLDPKVKEAFLNYEVVVRDLGSISSDELKEAFSRINATAYPLNAVELDNAQYEGAFKNAAQDLADEPFFHSNSVFSAADIRRMRDMRFCLRLLSTVIETYFNGYKTVEVFLERYNESFPEGNVALDRFRRVFRFIDSCGFPRVSRFWQQADLFTAIVELYWAIHRDQLEVSPERIHDAFLAFYERVDSPSDADQAVNAYRKAASLATNNRNNQIQRGTEIRKIIDGTIRNQSLFAGTISRFQSDV